MLSEESTKPFCLTRSVIRSPPLQEAVNAPVLYSIHHHTRSNKHMHHLHVPNPRERIAGKAFLFICKEAGIQAMQEAHALQEAQPIRELLHSGRATDDRHPSCSLG